MPGRILLVLAAMALVLVAVMDLLAPGSYIRAALDSERSFLSPHQRLERLFDRGFRPHTPMNPFR